MDNFYSAMCELMLFNFIIFLNVNISILFIFNNDVIG